jgi:hypothetical protein
MLGGKSEGANFYGERSGHIFIDEKVHGLGSNRVDFGLLDQISGIGECAFDLGFGEAIFVHDFLHGHTTSEGADDDRDVNAGACNDWGAATDLWIDVDVGGDFHGGFSAWLSGFSILRLR